MPKDMPADVKIEAVAGKPVELPSGDFIANAEMTRSGADLHLTGPDGHTIIVEGYFAQQNPPDLVTHDGAHLSAAMVSAFVPPEHAGQYASSGQIANDASPVGKITQEVGDAQIVHADGTKTHAVIGAPVYEGDVIETSKTGAVNIQFVDHTTFAISESARMSVDQFVYHATDHSGSTFFSMLQGVFVYTSGLIGKTDPGSVNIETPVGSIGIRGTVIAGHILPAGHNSEITIVDGAITLTNGTGTQELNNTLATVSVSGYESAITSVPMDAGTFNSEYSAMSSVIGNELSHFTSMVPGSSNEHAPAFTAPAGNGGETAPTSAPVTHSPAGTSPAGSAAPTSGTTQQAANTAPATTTTDTTTAPPPPASASSFGSSSDSSSSGSNSFDSSSSGSSSSSSSASAGSASAGSASGGSGSTGTGSTGTATSNDDNAVGNKQDTGPVFSQASDVTADNLPDYIAVAGAAAVTYTLTFKGDAIGNVSASDFTNMGTIASADIHVNTPQINGDQVTVVVDVSSSGTLQMEISNPSDIKDVNGVSLNASGSTISLEQSNPIVVSATTPGTISGTNGGSANGYSINAGPAEIVASGTGSNILVGGTGGGDTIIGSSGASDILIGEGSGNTIGIYNDSFQTINGGTGDANTLELGVIGAPEHSTNFDFATMPSSQTISNISTLEFDPATLSSSYLNGLGNEVTLNLSSILAMTPSDNHLLTIGAQDNATYSVVNIGTGLTLEAGETWGVNSTLNYQETVNGNQVTVLSVHEFSSSTGSNLSSPDSVFVGDSTHTILSADPTISGSDITATDNNQLVIGSNGSGVQSLSDGTGSTRYNGDFLIGNNDGDGNQIYVSNASFSFIDGGNETVIVPTTQGNVLNLATSGLLTFDFAGLTSTPITGGVANIDTINLDGNNTVNLNIQDVFNMTNNADGYTLTITNIAGSSNPGFVNVVTSTTNEGYFQLAGTAAALTALTPLLGGVMAVASAVTNILSQNPFLNTTEADEQVVAQSGDTVYQGNVAGHANPVTLIIEGASGSSITVTPHPVAAAA